LAFEWVDVGDFRPELPFFVQKTIAEMSKVLSFSSSAEVNSCNAVVQSVGSNMHIYEFNFPEIFGESVKLFNIDIKIQVFEPDLMLGASLVILGGNCMRFQFKGLNDYSMS
jgi:hypothetical protein